MGFAKGGLQGKWEVGEVTHTHPKEDPLPTIRGPVQDEALTVAGY
mgnify:CR=1 FL=1